MKRSLDIILAVIGLILLSPLMLLLAAAIKLSSPGRVLYSQARVGKGGRIFTLHKFRTMVADADRLGSSVTTATDARITPLGRVLRRSKLDELPQLWNVVAGDMSLVGPRPDVPEIIDTFTPEMRRILDIRPGITSLASLHMRDEESLLSIADNPDEAYARIVLPAEINLDMQHVSSNSIGLYFKILLLSIWALTLGRLFPARPNEFVDELRTRILALNQELSPKPDSCSDS